MGKDGVKIMEILAQKLRENGLKVTPQRLSIYGILRDTKEHPSAEKIYEAIKQRMPSMSFNTVYKTLSSLEENGLIKKLVVEESHYRFDADTSPHAHILCVQCKKLEDVQGDFGERVKMMREEFSARHNRELFGEELYFFGYCLECAGKKQ
ncbi:MAG TPA: transcriptional repressor [Firmicutes bacterium]|nr:transcriptional repressor [Bacillota bacterium]